MNTLLTLRDSDVYPGVKDINPNEFSIRHAARAVVMNDLGQVALLKVSRWGYHKLPGGGVEGSEDMQTALNRELLEEIGCRTEVVQELGEIIEYRNGFREKQVSHCWLARQVGEVSAPSFTEDEQRDGFRVVWVDNISSAIATIAQDTPTRYPGRFIGLRDLTFLQTAATLLAEQQLDSSENTPQ